MLSYNTKYVLTIWHNNCTTDKKKQNLIYPSKVKSYVHTKSYTDLTQTRKITMTFKGWIIKQSVVYPFHGILLSNQKEKCVHGTISMDLREENYAEWRKTKKRPISEDYKILFT